MSPDNPQDLEIQSASKNLAAKVVTAAVLEQTADANIDPFNPANVPAEYVKAWEDCVNTIIGTILTKLGRKTIVVTNRDVVKFIQSGRTVETVKNSTGVEYYVKKGA